MAQNLTTDISGQDGGTWKTTYNNTTAALLSSMSGTTEPGSGVRTGGTPWLDTTTNQVKIRNAGDTEWVPTMRYPVKIDERDMSSPASFNAFLTCPAQGATIEKVRIQSTTATTSSDGTDNYTFDVYNVTDSHSLFGTAPTTNGSEIVANTPYDMTPDQNNTITEDDCLEFRVTVNGSPTPLTRMSVEVVWIWLVA